jgi:hypothetical protein
MSSSKDPSLPDVGPNLSPENLAMLRKLLAEAQGSKNPEGPTPPQAPQPGQNADVTGARPLHTETTPARQLDIQPSAKPNIFTPRPLTTSASSTGETTMSDDMLETVSAYAMTSVIHHKTATFTPTSHAMYVVLAQMDKTMSTTKRWLDNSFGWIPSYSRLYYGVLYIIQVLRAQRDAGTLDMGTLPILQAFEMYFNPGNLLIAGPLVPIFKALSTSKIDSDLYGNVAPQLPGKINMNADHSVLPHSLDPNISMHIPAIPALFDEICTAIQLQAGANNIYQNILITGNSPGSFGTAFTAQSPATPLYNIPGLAQRIALTDLTVTNFFQCAPSYTFPPPFANNLLAPGITNWFQYCRLATGPDDHHEWLSRLAGTMNNYAQFFRGSIPLGDIPSSSLPTGQILGHYRPNTLPTADATIRTLASGSGANPTTGYYYQRPEITSLAADWRSKTMAIPVPEEWRAFYSQVNCLHNSLSDNPPRNFRTGTYWTLPNVRTIDNVDSVHSIPLLIARKFHRSNRDETI